MPTDVGARTTGVPPPRAAAGATSGVLLRVALGATTTGVLPRAVRLAGLVRTRATRTVGSEAEGDGACDSDAGFAMGSDGALIC